jgi:hypothetical protein
MDNQYRLILFVVAFLFPASAFAGVNVEQRRADTEHQGVFGDLVLSSNLAYGNTNVFSISGGTLVGYRNNNHMVLGIASGGFASNLSGIRFANKQMGHLRYNYRFYKWFWWEVFTQAEHDEFILLNFRSLTGTGPRFHLLDGKVNRTKFDIFYGTAYMAEYEMLDGEVLIEPRQANTFVHRWNNYLTVIVNPRDAVKIQSTIYYQPRFDKFLDFRLMNDNSLSIELADWTSKRSTPHTLELDLMASFRYDSLPAIFCSNGPALTCADDDVLPLKTLDIATSTALSVEF